MTMKIRYRTMVFLLTLCLAAPAWAEQRSFVPGSLSDIERNRAKETFILVLWELSCPPCHEEMAMLGRLRQDYPDMNLVLVGTDSMQMQQDVATVLDRHGLTGVESWLFDDDNIERLRFSIDPEWYGELPRNYFYDAAGERTGVSGKLNENRVRDWLSLD
jgi:thiol-disulfide isomerase/thioredoxin